MNFTIPLAEDSLNEIFFEMSLHQSWIELIDVQCEEYGMERNELLKELIKLGLVVWTGREKNNN